MGKLQPTRRTYVLLSVLVVLAVGGGIYRYRLYQQNERVEHARLLLARRQAARFAAWQAARDPSKATEIADLRRRFFRSVPHVVVLGSPVHHPFSVPTNESWQLAQHERIEASLSGQHYAYIVLPVEENIRYYDRVTRLMSARWIARALHRATGKRVMSPELALRAIGARAVRLNDAKVAKLAKATGAKVVHILLATGPTPNIPGINRRGLERPATRDGRVYVALTTATGHVIRRFHTRFHDAGTRPCETIFAKLAPKIAAAMGGSAKPESEPAMVHGSNLPVIPKHIAEMTKLAVTPLDNAVYLQFVAMLTPTWMHYDRRRLFERSLVALRDVSPSSRYGNLLSARALFYLYRRPAALAYLGSPKTVAGKALKEYLDGNYPELAALVPKIKSPILRAMALIELKSLGYWYSKSHVGRNVSLPLPSAQWSSIIDQANRDGDTWYAPENMKFFSDVHGLFPAFDAAFDQAVAERMASGAYDPDSPNITVFQSLFHRVFRKGGPGCCDRYGAKLQRADIWLLYRDIAVGNLLRRLNREDDVYGLYQSAVHMARHDAPWLAGNPTFLMMYASALADYGDSLGGAKKTFIYRRAYAVATKLIRYSGEIGYDTNIGRWVQSRALSVLQDSKLRSRFRTMAGVLCPLSRCDYPSSFRSDDADYKPSALPYDNDAFSELENAVKEKKLDAAAIQQILATRFDGAPDKISFVAKRLIRAGHRAQAVADLRTAVKTPNAPWAVYHQLGHLMIDGGKYAEAAKTFMRFRDFKHPGQSEDPVTTSNRADDAGMSLFFAGQYKDAEPLFRIAAHLETGAQSEYWAIEELAIIHAQYRRAALAAYENARRYHGVAAYGDYLILLELGGMHAQARAGFRALAPRFSNPYLWTAMLTGDRIQKRSFAQIDSWVRKYAADTQGDYLVRQAAQYLTTQAGTDRRVTRAEVKAVAKVDDSFTSHGIAMRTGRPLSKQLDRKIPAIIHSCQKGPLPKWFARQAPPGLMNRVAPRNCWTVQLAPKSYARHPYAGFLYAYSLLQQRRYFQSVKAFLLYDAVNPIVEHDNSDASLPYFAMALVGAHQIESLKRLLAIINRQEVEVRRSFNSQLTRAIVDAAFGRSAASSKALTFAFHHAPDNAYRPYSYRYQVLQTAEWIYNKTGDKRVLHKALTWAKEYEVISPHDGWEFAFEAKYAKRRADRVRAAAFAEYLDPQSLWLSQVPKSIRRAGRRWWAKHDPFRFKKKQVTKEQVSM